MRDVQIDKEQNLRCWKCGGKSFSERRTTRSKVLVGVGSLVTNKKLKCRTCGEYNLMGNAKPFTGPGSSTDHSKNEGESGGKDLQRSALSIAPQQISFADELFKLVALRDAGALSEDEFAVQKNSLLGRDSGASSSNIELDEFEVVLTDAGQKKIPVIKVIRRITNLRLKEAKDLVDTAPSTLLRRVSRETAEHVQMELNVVGASIEIMKSTTDE